MNTRIVIGQISLAAMAALPLACTPSSNSSDKSATGASPSAVKSASASAFGYVVTKDTPYFKDSPAQPMPADGTFRTGTQVTVVKSMGNYKLVQSSDGIKAYVASDAIKPAGK